VDGRKPIGGNLPGEGGAAIPHVGVRGFRDSLKFESRPVVPKRLSKEICRDHHTFQGLRGHRQHQDRCGPRDRRGARWSLELAATAGGPAPTTANATSVGGRLDQREEVSGAAELDQALHRRRGPHYENDQSVRPALLLASSRRCRRVESMNVTSDRSTTAVTASSRAASSSCLSAGALLMSSAPTARIRRASSSGSTVTRSRSGPATLLRRHRLAYIGLEALLGDGLARQLNRR